MAKTVAVREETWERMKKMVDSGEAENFDDLIRKMIDRKMGVPDSMFGIDRNRKGVHLTKKEHEDITRDSR